MLKIHSCWTFVDKVLNDPWKGHALQQKKIAATAPKARASALPPVATREEAAPVLAGAEALVWLPWKPAPLVPAGVSVALSELVRVRVAELMVWLRDMEVPVPALIVAVVMAEEFCETVMVAMAELEPWEVMLGTC